MGLKEIWRQLAQRSGAAAEGERGKEPAPLPPDELEARLGYRFANQQLLEQALRHRSHGLVARQSRQLSNERLEFLGDAVLGLIVNEHLYRSFPGISEGDLTKMKSLLVCRQRLAEVAAELNLGAHIRMSPSESATGGRSRASILADATEAVLGAVYLDGGLASVQRVIHGCLLADCEQILARCGQENFKSRLQEVLQARFKSPPRYRVVAIEGPDHARRFRVSVSFRGRLLGQGVGPSKKIAEQSAARQALAALDTLGDLLDGIEEPGDD